MTILASTVMGDLKIGDSISVNGTCLTVVNKAEHNFSVEVSPETLSVTTLGQFTAGAPLNLERAMKLNDGSVDTSWLVTSTASARFAAANRMGTRSCSQLKPAGDSTPLHRERVHHR